MKLPALAAACALLASAIPALAQDLTPDTKRMLAYGTTAVVVRSCGLPITPAENGQMMDALAKYADRQKQLTQDEFTEAMKAAGAQIGSNRELVCQEAAKTSIADMLAEDEAAD